MGIVPWTPQAPHPVRALARRCGVLRFPPSADSVDENGRIENEESESTDKAKNNNKQIKWAEKPPLSRCARLWRFADGDAAHKAVSPSDFCPPPQSTFHSTDRCVRFITQYLHTRDGLLMNFELVRSLFSKQSWKHSLRPHNVPNIPTKS